MVNQWFRAYLEAHAAKAHRLGLCGNFTRSNLADANERCDWRLYCEFAQALIRIARKSYATETLGPGADRAMCDAMKRLKVGSRDPRAHAARACRTDVEESDKLQTRASLAVNHWH